MTEKPPGRPDPIRLRDIRDFMRWIIGTSAESLGTSIVELAVPLAAFMLAADAGFAGAMGSVYAGVFAAVVLIGGALVDRFDRRIGMVIRAVSGFILWGALGVLLLTQALTVWIFIILLILAALSAGLFGSADNAALRSIVPDALIVRAQGPIQARGAIVQLAGAPLGGLLYGLSPSLPFFLAAACGLVLAVSAFAIRADLRPRVAATAEVVKREKISDIPAEIRAGLRFCLGDRVILQAVFIVMAVNLGTAMILQISTLSLINLGYRSMAVGMLLLCATAMMLLSSILTPAVVTRVRGGVLILGSLFIMAGSCAVTALFPSYRVVLVSLGLIGFVVPLISAIVQGYVILRTPAEMQGRIGSLLTLASLGLNAAAPVTAGLLVASDLGRAGYAGSAVVLTLVAGITATRGALRGLGRAGEEDG